MAERVDPRYPAQQVRIFSWVPDWIPVALTGEGPYGPSIEKVYKVYTYVRAILSDSLDWLSSPGGQKTLLIKFPEAIVTIVHRIGPPTSIPSKLLRDFANLVQPLHKLGRCAKTFLAFVEVGSKFKTMFKDPDMYINYVVMDENHHPRKAQFPLNAWAQWSNVFQNFVDWGISVGECEVYLRSSAENSGHPFTAPLVNWGARYMSIKSLCFEGWFLYQTWWKGEHLHGAKRNEKIIGYIPFTERVTLSKREIIGSALKISLSVVCLSLDLFNKLAAHEKKPFWLETAIFWTRIAPTFITPAALRYWPNIVTKPLYMRAT